MRLLAVLLLAALVTALPADEPKRNPFRDGSGGGKAEPPAPPKAPAPDLDAIRKGPRVVRGADVGVGRFVPHADLKSNKLLVVAFTDAGCPLCKKYGPTLARLEKEYAAKGVAFLFVDATAADTADELKKAVADRGFAGRVVHDKDGKLAAALEAKSTTDVFVLDSARTVVYRGAVDDQYGFAYALDAPRNNYLRSALDLLLVGKPPVIAATTAPGCDLDVKPAATKSELTYHARIERIIQNNCAECHHAGGGAPFPLTKYEDIAGRKAAIKRAIGDGTMPPWFAAPPAKGEHTPWVNDRSLTADDKADLLAWLSGDLKKGDPADAPLPRSFESGWLIGKPDAVYQIPKAIAVKADGTMPYQIATVETKLDEDRWVQALEVQPTAREVTHHVLIFALPEGVKPGRGREEGQGFFAAYVPGNNTLVYPEGYAKKLPKGSTLVFQIHYTPNGKATTDQTRFGVVFAKQPPRSEVRVAGIVNASFTIPPGDGNKEVVARLPIIPFDAKILAFFPHAHLRGKAARYELKSPDGKLTTLLDVPRYDFNWQLMYRYAEPVTVPRGSGLVYTAWYDNSDKNPANPDPKKAVKWGPQTYEEMHLGYLEYVIEK